MAGGSSIQDTPELLVPDVAAWRGWLERNAETGSAVFLVLAKKGHTEPTSLTYAEALMEALCHGWIDGQVRRRDDATVNQRFSPRGPRSMWSARNVGYVAQLEAEGRMAARGRAEVEKAKADGRWDVAYAGPATMQVPEDFAAAVRANPRAQAMFDVLTSQNRFALLHRLGQLKTAAARERRIVQYVDMLARGDTAYPQKRGHPDD
ncbi:YdeI/OmpD-associated family protein [Jatrophihabitans sp. YIM 134969]